jgi:hypothetical protein
MLRTIPVFLVLVLSSVTSLHAGEGVLEINQACAESASGCFSGDTIGFPVTIDGSAGSNFVLTSDLTTPDVDLDGIEVATDGVTIDLNGFEVAGPVSCTGLGSAVTCSPTGTGRGIDALNRLRITVRNGRVRGFGNVGVWVGGRSHIEGVTTVSNRNTGIYVGADSIVRSSTSYQNKGYGIFAETSSVIEGCTAGSNFVYGIGAASSSIVGNVARDNSFGGIDGAFSVIRNNVATETEQDGISGEGSFVQSNLVYLNGGFGLDLDFAVDGSYRENVIQSNTGGTVNGGVDAGANVINGVVTATP